MDTIDDKLNYLIENGTGSRVNLKTQEITSNFNFISSGSGNEIITFDEIEKIYGIESINCSGLGRNNYVNYSITGNSVIINWSQGSTGVTAAITIKVVGI